MPAVWGMGSQEDSLAYADLLITNQRYDEAILYLSDFIKKNPARFETAQKQMQRITKIRSAYNTSATALIEVLKNDPMNQEKKLAIISELESYERVPNPTIKEFVEKTKEFALFTYNQAKFEEIMNQGRFLIDSRNFIEAARLYESGFALYRPEFSNAGFDHVIVDNAFERVATVSGEIIRFNEQSSLLHETFINLAEAFKRDDDQTTVLVWERAKLLAAGILDLRKSVVDQGRALEAAFVDIVANDPSITDNSFLPFAFRLVLGRKSENRLEGIAGAIDSQWINSLGIAQAALDEKLAMNAESAIAAYDAGDWSSSQTRFNILAADADHGAALISLWGNYASSDLIERSTPLGQAALELKGTDFLEYIFTARTARSLAALSSIQAGILAESKSLAGYNPAESGVEKAVVITAFKEYLKTFNDMAQAIESLFMDSDNSIKKMVSWSEAGYGSTLSLREMSMLDSRLLTARQHARNMETQAVATAASWEYGQMAAMAKTAQTMSDQGKLNLDGVASDDTPLPGTLYRYPLKALSFFEASSTVLRSLRSDLDAFQATYRSYPAPIATTPSVLEWITLAQVLARQTDAAINESITMEAKAIEQKRMADYNKLEAERRVAESRNAFRSNNFLAAKDRLALARERYLSSLYYEYNEQLQAESDSLLAELAAMIRKTENDLVVSDTRQLLTRGKSLYAQGEFERAESSFLQAQIRWSATNARPDFEVEYWLKLVKTAMNVKTGRSIPVSSPLFPEISQILALAKRYYDEGVTLLSKRDRPGALKQFVQAKLKLSEVKVVFPLNQEASILDLKIDQLSDPDEFGKKFLQMFNEAKSNIEAETDLPLAYNNLKDMETIQPRYPGLRTLLETVERKIGLRLQQPDQNAIAESNALLQSAQRIFDTGQISQYQSAQAQLEQALAIDPNNQAASMLKDRIATSIGGDTAIVLPSTAEILYIEASTSFASGNFTLARAKLSQLTTIFPQGLSMQKVADLDTRLKTQGY